MTDLELASERVETLNPEYRNVADCTFKLGKKGRLHVFHNDAPVGYLETGVKSQISDNDVFLKFYWIATSLRTGMEYYGDSLLDAVEKLLS